MAEKREGNNKKTVEETTKHPIQPYEARDSLFRIIQILLPGIGIFAALCYFLGRLHLEAYYSALGMSPNALDFTPEDYMFSSFNLIIMCLFICYWLFMYWRAARRGIPLFLGFPFPRSSSKSERATNILMIILPLITAGSIIVAVFYTRTIVNAPGVIGMIVGFAIGMVTNLCFWVLENLFGKKAKRFSYTGLFIVALMLLAYLPLIVTNLAKLEAESDLQKFPQAVLVSEHMLPNQLQSSPQTPNESIELKVIITNNHLTYVLQQDSESTNEWQVYAIPENSIKHMIYLHKK